MPNDQEESAPSKAGLFGSPLAGANVRRAAAAELVGTAILVYSGTSVAVGATLAKTTAGGAYNSLAVALVFALALVALVAALGHVSGAHLNPAVTLTLATTRNFPWRSVPAYVAAQLGGAILASLATWVTYGNEARTKAFLGASFPTSGVSAGRAFIVEALIGFILVFVIMAVATDQRVPGRATASVAVGFALGVAVFIAGPISGGAANPARALGPMIVSFKFTAAWVYVIGPIVGALIAGQLYDRVLIRAEPPERAGEESVAEESEAKE